MHNTKGAMQAIFRNGIFIYKLFKLKMLLCLRQLLYKALIKKRWTIHFKSRASRAGPGLCLGYSELLAKKIGPPMHIKKHVIFSIYTFKMLFILF